MSVIDLPILESTKSCGECKACCTVLGVKAVKKRQYQPCSYETNQGCGIYQQRPEECRTYECVWLTDSELPIDLRPDIIGVILDRQRNEIGNCLVVRQLHSEALKSEAVMDWIYQKAEEDDAIILVVENASKYHVLLPENKQHLAPLAKKIRLRDWDFKKK